MEPAALPPALHDLLTAGRLRLEVQPLIMADVLAGLPDGGRDEGLFRASAKLRYADVPFDMARDLILRAAAACDPPFPPSQAEKCVLSAYRRFEPSGAHIIDDQIEGFDRVLLDDLVANDPEPTNWLIQDVLVRGQTHLVFGEPESGKTILAIRWMLDAVAAGETVVFVDEESGARSVADKLRAMRAGAVDQGLHYFPFPSLDATKSATFQDTLDGLQPALVVFDSMTDLLAASGLDENSGVEVTGWFKSVAEPLSRRPYSPAVVIIDHVSKDTLNTRYSVGSRAKKAKSDVMWLVQRDGAFDRVTTSDVELIRQKNRPGTLPQTVKYVVGGRDGVLVAERYDPLVHGVETWPGRTRQIFEYIASQDGFATTSAIRAVCDDVKRQSLDPYFDWLTGQGLVTLETNGRASGYRLTEKGFSTVSLTQPLRQPDAAFATGDLRQVTPPIRGVPVAKPNGVETEEKKGLRHWWID
jgi:KaiC/GvpD/RAD55 family RecA-like ATPase/predicted transcriptional regulator